jgi:hypothetical protein
MIYSVPVGSICWLCDESVTYTLRSDVICCQRCFDIQQSIIFDFNKNQTFLPPDYIIDNIYLGCQFSSCDLEELQRLKIFFVLIAGDQLTAYFPDSLQYK